MDFCYLRNRFCNSKTVASNPFSCIVRNTKNGLKYSYLFCNFCSTDDRKSRFIASLYAENKMIQSKNSAHSVDVGLGFVALVLQKRNLKKFLLRTCSRTLDFQVPFLVQEQRARCVRQSQLQISLFLYLALFKETVYLNKIVLTVEANLNLISFVLVCMYKVEYFI